MPRRDDDSDLDRPRRRRPPRRRRESGTALMLVGIGAAVLLFVGGVLVAGYLVLREKPDALPSLPVRSGSDLDRLAGTWECTFRDPAGHVTMRKVKEIAGTTETATWYRPDGAVFRVNRVEFQLVQRGPNKVFRYFNGVVVEGVGAGQPFPSGEYVYTLDGDTWTEYEPSGGTIVWTRRW